MSATLYKAKRKAHLKIIFVGLIEVLLVVWVSIGVRLSENGAPPLHVSAVVQSLWPAETPAKLGDRLLRFSTPAISFHDAVLKQTREQPWHVANGVEARSIASTIQRSLKGARLSPAPQVAKVLFGCEPPFSNLIKLSSANLNMRCLT